MSHYISGISSRNHQNLDGKQLRSGAPPSMVTVITRTGEIRTEPALTYAQALELSGKKHRKDAI
jgi:hypothetical protein